MKPEKVLIAVLEEERLLFKVRERDKDTSNWKVFRCISHSM